MRRVATLVLLLVAAQGRIGATAQVVDTAAFRRGVDSVFAPWSRTTTPGCAVGVYTRARAPHDYRELV